MFRAFPAHHQELNDCSGRLCFYLRIVMIIVLCPWSGRPATGRTTNTTRLSPRYEGKTRGWHCSHWAPDDGRETPKTCWAVNKRQDNKLKNCCIWLVIYFNLFIHFEILIFYILTCLCFALFAVRLSCAVSCLLIMRKCFVVPEF
jgi:hypothetical protein